MKKIKVFLVDDSLVIQRKLAGIVSSDPSMEIAGTAVNGRLAISKISEAQPDIVIMDVEMPEMDGLETLALLRKSYSKLPIIMFSTLTDKGAEATIEALLLGADDYITKPSNLGGDLLPLQQIQSQLISKIKALSHKMQGGVIEPASSVALAPPSLQVEPKIKASPAKNAVMPALLPGRIDVLAIGASTGGPNALQAIIPNIPKNFSAPILIVQHMPPVFTKALANNFASKSSISVVEAEDGDLIFPGCAWIAPGDFHMGVLRDAQGVKIRLSKAPHENFCRPSVDWLFRSVAQVYGNHVFSIVLTGMGQDGYRGCEFVRSMGGYIMVQDEASSVVWGMPGFVAKAGFANEIVPLNDIVGGISRIVFRKSAASIE